jgi:hypothetical protein
MKRCLFLEKELVANFRRHNGVVVELNLKFDRKQTGKQLWFQLKI